MSRHVFRIYSASRGYALYSGNPRAGFTQESLDVTSAGVPSSYLKAQARLDATFRSWPSWSICFLHDAPDVNRLIAYGTLIEIGDESGRAQKISFVHAFEINRGHLGAAVDSVLLSLSPLRIASFLEEIGAVATDRSGARELISRAAMRIEEGLGRPAPEVQKRPCRRAVRRIEQDCAGAAPLAWRVMAGDREDAAPPWEVFDAVGNNGIIYTELECADSGSGVMKASELLREVIAPETEKPSIPAVDDGTLGVRDEEGGLDPGPCPDAGRPDVSLVARNGAGGRSDRLRHGVLLFLIVTLTVAVWDLASIHRRIRSLELVVRSSAAAYSKTTGKQEARNRRDEFEAVLQRALSSEHSQRDLSTLAGFWRADDRLLAITLRRAEGMQDHALVILDLLRGLKDAGPDVLNRRRTEVVRFLAAVEGVNPEVRNAAEALRETL